MTINFQTCTKLSYPWGTALHILHFTTVHKDTPFLVRVDPDTLLTYFTKFWELVITPIQLKNHFIAVKNTHISDILYDSCTFSRDSPMCWCHSLVLTYVSGDSKCPHMTYYPQHYCFQPIKVSLYTYPFILMHDRTPRTLFIITDMSKQTYRYNYYSNNLFSSINIQVISHLGETPGCLIWGLAQVFVCH